jgi:hypothetical protein
LGTVVVGTTRRTITFAFVAERNPVTERSSILTGLPQSKVTTRCNRNRLDPPPVGAGSERDTSIGVTRWR